MLTHEKEAHKRLHDHVMEESDQHRSRVEKPNQLYTLVLKHTILCMYTVGTSPIRTPLGQTKVSLINREVSLIQRLLSTQKWHLGQTKVSCLERCP